MRRPLLNKAQIDAVVDAMPRVTSPAVIGVGTEDWVRTEHGIPVTRADLRITLYLAARLDVTGKWPPERTPGRIAFDAVLEKLESANYFHGRDVATGRIESGDRESERADALRAELERLFEEGK